MTDATSVSWGADQIDLLQVVERNARAYAYVRVGDAYLREDIIQHALLTAVDQLVRCDAIDGPIPEPLRWRLTSRSWPAWAHSAVFRQLHGPSAEVGAPVRGCASRTWSGSGST